MAKKSELKVEERVEAVLALLRWEEPAASCCPDERATTLSLSVLPRRRFKDIVFP